MPTTLKQHRSRPTTRAGNRTDNGLDVESSRLRTSTLADAFTWHSLVFKKKWLTLKPRKLKVNWSAEADAYLEHWLTANYPI